MDFMKYDKADRASEFLPISIKKNISSRSLRSCMKWMVMCAFLILISASTALAQLPVGTILGVVKDPSGAIVPGAKVTVHSKDTDATRSVVTDSSGSYRFDGLNVGNYEVRVEQAGFKQGVNSSLALSVGQQAVADFALEVGEVSQTVDVRTDAVAVDTTSGSSSSLVDEKQMATLPLNGRNYIQLALMQPGAVEMKDKPQGSGANLGTTGTFFSANGAPPRSNAYLLDGTSLTVYGGASGASISGSTLGLDGIREFRIVTNNFSAEYGMVMGSQMLMVSKSGTNGFHGTAFEFLRNSALDAANEFDTPASSGVHSDGTPRRLPEFRRNNFGGAFGGPIRKDKTFFFMDFEGLREKLGTTNLSFTIPTGCRGPANTVITANPTCPQSSLGASSATISPVVANWLPLYPIANVGLNQTSWPFTQPTVENYGQVRVDHNLTAKDSLFVRYTIDDTTVEQASSQPGYPNAAISRGQFFTFSENHVFSPTLLNAARFSASRSNLLIGVQQYKTGPGYSFVPGEPMGNIAISGVGGLSAGGLTTSQGLQDVFAYSDDLFWTKGRHSLKFGTLINHYQVHAVNGLNTYGSLSFTNIAQFYALQPTSWTAITIPFENFKTVHFNTIGMYAQDDFKATPRLTLNIGLRYEFNTNVTEIHGRQAAIRDVVNDVNPTLGLMTKNPSYLNFSPRTGFAWDVQGNGKTAVRGGVALVYNIAGWVGIMHQTMREAPFVNQITVNPTTPITIPLTFPAATNLTARSASPYNYNMNQSKMLQYNLTIQRQLPWAMSGSIAYIGSHGYNLIQFSEGNPTIPQGIPGVDSNGNTTCVARPAGSTLPNLADQDYIYGQANACFLGANAATNQPNNPVEIRRNPYWGTFNSLIGGNGYSIYNGLQVSLEKALTHGLRIQTNYTWSRSTDAMQAQSGTDTSGNGSDQVQDPLHPQFDYSVSTFNLPNAFHLNALYNFPEVKSGNRIVRTALNGWGATTIFSYQSGFPFEPLLGSSRSRSYNGGNIGAMDHPMVVPGRTNANITRGTTAGCTGVAAGQRLGSRFLYYDPCGFYIQPAGFLGNEGRYMLRGPNFQNVDLSLVKDTKAGFLGESGAIEFRAEMFNVQNRANYLMPGISIFTASGTANLVNDVEAPTSTAAKITSAFPARQVQLAVKVIF